VSFADKKATIIYDPQAVDIPAMVQAVKRAGFSARKIANK
jgi:copper chaperone CopZ